MIKKLEMKFILLSMSALLLVLTIIITGINIINYNNVIKDADLVLAILSENNGAFPKKNGAKPDDFPNNLSPETPYETRYFSVLLDKDTHAVIQSETSRITSVDSADAIAYARQVIDQGKEQGFAENFRYHLHTEDDGIRIVFLDCGRKLDSFQDFLLVSVLISISGYAVVFVIITFFSNKIIRPISEGYEKQKQFITDAGHELKTPLTIIKADADILEMEFGENEWLDDIQKQAARLTSLTNDLVYLARMEESSDTIQMIEFPFSDVVSEASCSFQALAQTQGKEFLCNIQPMLSLTGNEKAIHQLITILLDNALKYSPIGGKVSLTLQRHNKLLLLSVFNTTAYLITKEKLPLLFERFYRIDPSRNSQTGGYGIGLSVAKAIVAAHNGKIQANTLDGYSLEISVTFPI